MYIRSRVWVGGNGDGATRGDSDIYKYTHEGGTGGLAFGAMYAFLQFGRSTAARAGARATYRTSVRDAALCSRRRRRRWRCWCSSCTRAIRDKTVVEVSPDRDTVRAPRYVSGAASSRTDSHARALPSLLSRAYKNIYLYNIMCKTCCSSRRGAPDGAPRRGPPDRRRQHDTGSVPRGCQRSDGWLVGDKRGTSGSRSDSAHCRATIPRHRRTTSGLALSLLVATIAVLPPFFVSDIICIMLYFIIY